MYRQILRQRQRKRGRTRARTKERQTDRRLAVTETKSLGKREEIRRIR